MVGRVTAVVNQLARCQGTVLVHQVGHACMKRDIALIPQPYLGAHVGTVVNITLLSAHHSPSAFGVGGADMGADRRIVPTRAGTVRYLVKPVTRSQWSDLDRLK